MLFCFMAGLGLCRVLMLRFWASKFCVDFVTWCVTWEVLLGKLVRAVGHLCSHLGCERCSNGEIDGRLARSTGTAVVLARWYIDGLSFGAG